MMLKIVLIGLFLVILSPLAGQSVNDIQLVNSRLIEQLTKEKYEPSKKGPVFWVLKGGIVLYQQIFSKQIFAGCIYEQTCSHFGMESIHLHGPFKGGFLAIDRIMRCNRIAYAETSPLSIAPSGKVIDNPEFYR